MSYEKIVETLMLAARIGKIDGRGWVNRNPGHCVSEQGIKNHYLISRTKGYLGAVSRLPTGRAFEVYAQAFRDAVRGGNTSTDLPAQADTQTDPGNLTATPRKPPKRAPASFPDVTVESDYSGQADVNRAKAEAPENLIFELEQVSARLISIRLRLAGRIRQGGQIAQAFDRVFIEMNELLDLCK